MLPSCSYMCFQLTFDSQFARSSIYMLGTGGECGDLLSCHCDARNEEAVSLASVVSS